MTIDADSDDDARGGVAPSRRGCRAPAGCVVRRSVSSQMITYRLSSYRDGGMTALRAECAALLTLLAELACGPTNATAQLIGSRSGVLPSRFATDPPHSKSLFVDNALFANLSGDVGLVRHRPAPAGIVLVPDKPWETFGFIGYHTVIQAGPTDYRMYYDTGWVIPDKTDFHRFTCLATSSDGVNWSKPSLGVSTFMNSTNNNIVWPRDWRDNTHAAGTVFIDANPNAGLDAKWKMVAQWNIGGVHATTMDDAGVYVMKSPDGITFEPMFSNRSLDWSDTKNVMFWSMELQKYVAYIRVDNASPDMHVESPCRDPWLVPARRVGRCLIEADQLHDWSLAGCDSRYGTAGTDVQCSKGPDQNCSSLGGTYEAVRCTPLAPDSSSPDSCLNYGSCGQVHATCNASGYCVVPRGPEPGPLCRSTLPYLPLAANGTQIVLTFDEADPSCLDIYTNSATEYEGTILFFPSAFEHMALASDPTPHNDGLVDIRFASSRSVLDDAHYPPTRNGRAPFVPLGVNSCPALVIAPELVDAGLDGGRMEWCYNYKGDLTDSAIDTGSKYMASGYLLSADGAQIYLYSGGEPLTHGGGATPGNEGSINIHSGVKRHIIRRDGFVGLEAGYIGAHLPRTEWPQVLTVPLRVPDAAACASGDVELRANILTGVGGGAFFQLEEASPSVASLNDSIPLMNYTLFDSVLLRGNWVNGPVSWTRQSTDDPDHSQRVLTPFSGRNVRVRVAMRDAELFSLSMGCVQSPKYTQCYRANMTSCAAAWGPHYSTIPCVSDAECRGYGTCGDVLAACVRQSNASQGQEAQHRVGSSTSVAPAPRDESVCVVQTGPEPGPLCGWF